MPSIDLNLKVWNNTYEWAENGEEWSHLWGNAERQWNTSIMPRISSFLPCDVILEIAPGHGRWTQFLKDHCKKLKIVDLSENCINHCRKRFNNDNNIDYFVNDGKSLEMISANSIDFLFSFDSLVHAEIDVLENYITQFKRILKPDGVAFIHHSNLKSYPKLFRKSKIQIALASFMPKSKIDLGWRAQSVSYLDIKKICNANNLSCFRQELINWEKTDNFLIDCISLICKPNSKYDNPYKLFGNYNFVKNARYVKEVFDYYQV